MKVKKAVSGGGPGLQGYRRWAPFCTHAKFLLNNGTRAKNEFAGLFLLQMPISW